MLRAIVRDLRRVRRGVRNRRIFLRDEVQVAPGTYIAPGVVIGRRTKINAASHLDVCTIGAYCAIAGRLVVLSANHRTEFLAIQEDAQRRVLGSDLSLLGPRQQTSIGNAVWIGDSVVVCPGVTIGDGAVIGAGAVVTRSIPPYAIAVGNPARVIKYRYPEEVVSALAGLDWWTWDDERLRANRSLFELDLTAVPAETLADRLAQL